ncbi:unnamed protein product [Rodentolepis nana]|uniref:Uncharacterized protein n=1 Tax=Rodentolepis nana TaxID=102285 RepID=A0A0R3TLP4_RODNA|nr:unnamed protein product [Rodentolepis nana]
MEITAGVRCPSKAYPYRSPKLQLTTAFQPASRDQSSGKHTPEDFDHELSQPNICSTRTLNTDHCIWRNIPQDARQWTKHCLTRSAGKVHKHARNPQSYCFQLEPSSLSISNTCPTSTQNPNTSHIVVLEVPIITSSTAEPNGGIEKRKASLYYFLGIRTYTSEAGTWLNKIRKPRSLITRLGSRLLAIQRSLSSKLIDLVKY